MGGSDSYTIIGRWGGGVSDSYTLIGRGGGKRQLYINRKMGGGKRQLYINRKRWGEATVIH